MDGLDASVDRIGSPALRFWRLGAYLAWTVPLMPVQALGLALRRRWVAHVPALLSPLLLPHSRHRGCARSARPAASGRCCSPPTTSPISTSPCWARCSPASFIAKTEVAGWPLFGWLARLQRSVFIDRRARSTAHQRDSIAARLAAGEALILFPEGTSGDGNRLLPFKSALFSVADHAPATAGAVTVQPVSIAYTRLDGMPLGRALRPFFAWYGSMSLAPHLWRMLGLGTARSRRRVPPADEPGRMRLAQGAGALLRGARRGGPRRRA